MLEAPPKTRGVCERDKGETVYDIRLGTLDNVCSSHQYFMCQFAIAWQIYKLGAGHVQVVYTIFVLLKLPSLHPDLATQQSHISQGTAQ